MTLVHHIGMTIEVKVMQKEKDVGRKIYVSQTKRRIKTHHIKPVVVG